MAILILSILFIKHFYADFYQQTDKMIEGKKKYGNPDGIVHSGDHGFLTTVIFSAISIGSTHWYYCLYFGLADFIIHYHIDWVKMRFGCQDTAKKKFWIHLGLDQLAHYLTYLGMAGIYVALL